MGIETALIVATIGAGIMQASSQMSAAEDEAQALVDQTNLENEQRLKRTRALAGSQKVSFLNSGLTLEGTPMSALMDTYDTGIEDMSRATENANKRSKSIISNARTAAIGTLIQSGVSAYGMSGGGFTAGATDAASTGASYLPESTLMSMGQSGNSTLASTAYSALEKQDMRLGYY